MTPVSKHHGRSAHPERTLLLTPTPDRHLPDTLSAFWVLTPNQHAASALGTKYCSLDGAARRVLRDHGLLVASELAQHRSLRQALRDTLKPKDIEGYLRLAAPTVRELLRTGLDIEFLEEDLSPRARQMLELTYYYRGLLRERQQVEPAEVLWAAAPLVEERKQVLVAGYPYVGRGEYAFLAALAAPGSLFILPDSDVGAERALAPRGWTVRREEGTPLSLGERLACRFTDKEVPTPEVRGYRFASQEAEGRFVLSEVKKLLHAGMPAEDMVVVARDDAAYGPLLKAIAWEYEIPLRASYALPLADTQIGAWLRGLDEVVRENAPFEATARLLAHPLCGSLSGEVWAEARRDHPHGIQCWRELEPRITLLQWPERNTRQAYLERLNTVLSDFGVVERTHRPADVLALSRLQSTMNGLGDPAGEEVHRADFLAELLELLSLLTVPADPAVKGVELHTPLAVYGARYQHVFVLGMAEGVLPAPVKDDPVLDFFERRALAEAGLPIEGALEAAHRETRSFEALLRTVHQSLTLSYPEIMEGRARIASPYFSALGLEPQTPPSKPLASVEEARRAHLQGQLELDEVLTAARQAWQVERRRESEAPCDEFDGIIGTATDPQGWMFSASQLVKLGQCPFKWFAERLLRLAELEEAEENVSPVLRGRIWHRTLERSLEEAKDAADIRRAALDALETAFTEAEQVEGVPATPTWPIRREEQLRELRQAISAPDFLPEGNEIVALEARFKAQWRGLRVAGVVDRVDRTPEGGLRFLDYKTRSSKPDGAQDGRGKASLDVQLPLYVEAAAPTLFAGEPVAEARYYSLTKAEALPPVKSDEDALGNLVERVKSHLQDGAYPVAPDVDGKACTFCDYELLCRRGHGSSANAGEVMRESYP